MCAALDFDRDDHAISGLFWDGRDSNPDALSGCRFSHHFGFRHRNASRLWSGLCLDHMSSISRRPRPSSLYTFSAHAELGSALSRRRAATEFTDFERIPSGFPTATAQRMVKSAVSAYSTIIPKWNSSDLLLIMLYDFFAAHLGDIGVLPSVATGAALPQEIPVLVEPHGDLIEALAVLFGQFGSSPCSSKRCSSVTRPSMCSCICVSFMYEISPASPRP